MSEVKQSKYGLPMLPDKWTIKGDFLVDEYGYERYVKTKGGQIDRKKVAIILSNHGFEEHSKAWISGYFMQEANAELIAKAPEMALELERLRAVNAELLEALKLARTILPIHGEYIEVGVRDIYYAVKNAIAKAESYNA